MAFRESVTKLELKKGKAVMTYTNGDRVTIFDPVIMMVKSTIFEEYPNRYADPVPESGQPCRHGQRSGCSWLLPGSRRFQNIYP